MSDLCSVELDFNDHYHYYWTKNGNTIRWLNVEIADWCEETIGPWRFGEDRSRFDDQAFRWWCKRGVIVDEFLLYEPEKMRPIERLCCSIAFKTSILFETEADMLVFRLRWC